MIKKPTNFSAANRNILPWVQGAVHCQCHPPCLRKKFYFKDEKVVIFIKEGIQCTKDEYSIFIGYFPILISTSGLSILSFTDFPYIRLVIWQSFTV